MSNLRPEELKTSAHAERFVKVVLTFEDRTAEGQSKERQTVEERLQGHNPDGCAD